MTKGRGDVKENAEGKRKIASMGSRNVFLNCNSLLSAKGK